MKTHLMQEELHRQSEAPQINLKLKNMKPLLRHVLLLLLACSAYLCSIAQCSAVFTYSVGYNKVVTFVAHDTVGATHRWTFGDGTTALVTNKGVVQHAYAQPGQYEVKHFMEKPNSNCKDSSVQKITVEALENCKASFAYKKKPGMMTYEFFNQSFMPSGLKQAVWSFGDGSSVTDSNSVVHTYTQPGVYNVCLFIETNGGCKSNVCQQLIVIDSSNACNITAKFEYRKDSLDCKKVRFINLSTPISPNVHFTWKFGDGTTSNDVNPAHVYNQPGKYYVCLVSQSDSNCRKEYCDSVIVKCDTIPNPCNITAKFDYRKDSLDCKKVKFINLSTPISPNVHFVWKFGDGTTSNDVSPVHVYNQPGKYYVCLVSESGSNCRKEYCDSVIVKCDTIPNPCNITAKFEYRKDSLDCKKIRFINLSTPISSAVHFVWKFGDGTTSNDVSPIHVYHQPGRYYVCLVSESGNNCRKEFCDSIIVKCDTNTNPNPCNIAAKFESKRDAAQWNTVWFNNLSQPIANIRQTYWYYGDGTTSQDFNTFHTYANAGVYQVCLKVIGLNGCISSYCDTVRVKKDSCVANAKFTYTSTPQQSQTIKFIAVYQTNTAKYYWSFGDGTSGEGMAVAHRYANAGRYKVCLTVVDGQCKVMYCQEIGPGASCDSLSVKYEYKRSPNRPNEISFFAVSNMPLGVQTWSIYKAGSTTPVTVLAQNNPVYVFTDTGRYRVCLTAMTTNLCIREYCENIAITVVNGRVTELSASPNPAISTISLNVSLNRPEQVLIRFMDGHGAVNRVFSKNGATGNNRFVLPVEGLSQGIYLVEIRTNTQRWFSRFQKG